MESHTRYIDGKKFETAIGGHRIITDQPASGGGTDAGAIQRSRGGVPSFTLSIPTRYVHTVNEMAAIADIDATVLLLARYLEEAHTRRYGYEDEG